MPPDLDTNLKFRQPHGSDEDPAAIPLPNAPAAWKVTIRQRLAWRDDGPPSDEHHARNATCKKAQQKTRAILLRQDDSTGHHAVCCP